MIFNDILPFIPCDEISHRILVAALIKFRKNPDKNLISMEEDLKEIFIQKIL
jgi:hypothetical protein